jgi:hypothetical protein
MNEETLARAIKKRQATCQKIGFFRDTFVARVFVLSRKRTYNVMDRDRPGKSARNRPTDSTKPGPMEEKEEKGHTT